MNLLKGFLKQWNVKDSVISKAESDPKFSVDLSQVENVLSDLPEEKAKFLSALALLLGRVAYADSDVSDTEKHKMKDLLIYEMKLSPDQAQAVTSIAIERTLTHGLESHLILDQMNKLASFDQKRDVLRTLFALAADEDISVKESEEINLISKGLGFDQNEFIAIRSEFRDHLSVLKKAN